MNKRIKKKRELIEQVQVTKEVVDIVLKIIKNLLDENAEQANEIAELRELVERNAQATNSEITTITLDTTKLDERVSYLESENKSMRVELEVGKFKKPFWKR
ncbi:hypothetical protein [Streptococcus suis]|uniref:hypothetical protein n=1 Tax=Streptococcus suis TaxID=1307 RepID=UPI003908B077